MRIEQGSSSELTRQIVESALAGYSMGRFCEDRSLPSEAAKAYVVEQTMALTRGKNRRYCAAFSDGGQVLGLLVYGISDWDTEHFGFPFASLSFFVLCHAFERAEVADALLGEFDAWCARQRIRFVSSKLPSLALSEIHAMERHGFVFIESSLYNMVSLHALEEHDPALPTLRVAGPDDAAVMVEYAKGAFASQRFYADSNFDKAKADSLYERWILSGFASEDMQTLVLDVDGEPAAFMMYMPMDLREYFGFRTAKWEMAVVGPALRGKGIGTAFFRSLLQTHREQGFQRVDSILTLRNMPSLNLHNKLLFKGLSIEVTLHRWSS